MFWKVFAALGGILLPTMGLLVLLACLGWFPSADPWANGGIVSLLALVGLTIAALWAHSFSQSYYGSLQAVHQRIETGPSPAPAKVAADFVPLMATLDAVRQSDKHDLESAQQSRKQLERMLELLPEGFLVVHRDDRVLHANPSLYRLFGLAPRDSRGEKLWKILRHPKLRAAISATAQAGSFFETEFEVFNPPKVLQFSGRTIDLDGEVGVLGLLHDVTELRRLELMRHEFVANVSHELKTPLAAIKAFTETLIDNDIEERDTVKHFLRRIDEQSERLHALVLDMLMLARIESKDQHFEVQMVDVVEAIQKCLRSFAGDAYVKHLELGWNVEEDAQFVRADPEGVGTILGNLVDNAVKYTPGGGKIWITTQRSGDTILMQVHDTGVGIPKDHLDRIFERFYRVDKARSRELGGTGLGLSIVKHLCQTFGGSVAVTSRLNQGSCFTVTLPSAKPSESADSVAGSADLVGTLTPATQV